MKNSKILMLLAVALLVVALTSVAVGQDNDAIRSITLAPDQTV